MCMQSKSKSELDALRKWIKLEIKHQLAKEYYGGYDSRHERSAANEAFNKLCEKLSKGDEED